MRLRILLTFLFGFLLVSATANATQYSDVMLGANEVPPVDTPAFGFTFVDITGDTMSVHVEWTGLIGGNPSAAHIHCCTQPGTNIGVAVGFPGFPATLSGVYDHVFNLLDPSIYTSAFLNDFGGGTAQGAEKALIDGLNAGLAYSNIHNATFRGGEIRGFLAPVPEPSTLLLITPALGIAGLIRRKLSL